MYDQRSNSERDFRFYTVADGKDDLSKYQF